MDILCDLIQHASIDDTSTTYPFYLFGSFN